MKRIIKGLAAVIVVIVAGLAGLFLYFGLTMKPVPTGPVSDSITAFHDGFVNFFLIKTSSGWIAIDTGNSRETAAASMKKMNFDPEKVTHVFLTHADADHAGGITAFPRAQIVFPSEERQMVNGRTKRMFFGIVGRYGKMDTKGFRFIADKEKITVDKTVIEAFLMPGHTPGHTAYLVDDSAIFLGDGAVIGKDNRLVTLPWFINNDTDLARASLARILAAVPSVKRLITAHGGVITR